METRLKPAVGLPIALDAEAWCLLGARRGRGFDRGAVCIPLSHYGVDIRALRSGVGLKNALAAARRLVREGVQALLSVGVAGGLHPDSETGELIVGDKILEQVDGEEYVAWKSDLAFTNLALSALLTEGIRARRGSIVSVETPVSSAREKDGLYQKTHALVSDMESGSIARAAAESNIPFLALRVVIDPPRKTLDPDISGCLDQQGKVCFPVLWRSLCRRPSLFPELLLMTRDLAIALSALRRAWEAQIRHTLPSLIAKSRSQEDQKFRSPSFGP